MCYILYLGEDKSIINQTKGLVTASHIFEPWFKKITIKQLLKNLQKDIEVFEPEAVLIDEYYLLKTPWLIKEIKKFYQGPVIATVSIVNGRGRKFIRNGANDYILNSMYEQEIVEKIIKRSKAVIDFESKIGKIKNTLATVM